MGERSGYRDTDAKRILERAAAIDAEGGRELDVPALREIRAEAGISASAVDRALQEHETAVPIQPWLTRHRPLLTTVAIIAVLLFFFAFYAIGRTVPPPP